MVVETGGVLYIPKVLSVAASCGVPVGVLHPWQAPGRTARSCPPPADDVPSRRVIVKCRPHGRGADDLVLRQVATASAANGTAYVFLWDILTAIYIQRSTSRLKRPNLVLVLVQLAATATATSSRCTEAVERFPNAYGDRTHPRLR